jgi:hypothetical protein
VLLPGGDEPLDGVVVHDCRTRGCEGETPPRALGAPANLPRRGRAAAVARRRANPDQASATARAQRGAVIATPDAVQGQNEVEEPHLDTVVRR